MENPDLRMSMGMGPDKKGVRIRRIEPTAPESHVLKPSDIILSFDGINIANDGTGNLACFYSETNSDHIKMIYAYCWTIRKKYNLWVETVRLTHVTYLYWFIYVSNMHNGLICKQMNFSPTHLHENFNQEPIRQHSSFRDQFGYLLYL